ncbi:DUF805 domain-containing protein [Roseovarius spongiae]|uniref:DUF805 domain-containing protein n=1 Tax=Roseovarius spongiae TaxID=2320272 RepID=A0A3A8BAB9_9RHOB|nr:DUF805 domain-containing protein [Roseovarius spongiae]RKF16024.1 DUF805 domain-containing protein [Roseovarius spongiae]
MGFPEAVKTCLTQKYVQFSGRASRPEYWWFFLAYVLGAIIASFLGSIVYLLYILAVIVPVTAAGYRRLQDTGRPGWYIFIPVAVGLISMFLMPAAPVVEDGQLTSAPSMGSMGLMAILGIVQLVLAVIYIWWLTRPSDPETNAYGPPPAA